MLQYLIAEYAEATASDSSTEEYEENSDRCITRVLRCLRDSRVDVPIEKIKFDPEQLASLKEGDVIKSTEGSRPDFLTHSEIEGKLLPVFSSTDQMPSDYLAGVDLVSMAFMDVCGYFLDLENVPYIVVDAFTNNFMVNADMVAFVQSLPSEIEA